MLKGADRDGHVVEDAEPFPVIRKRVMESSAQIDSDPALVRLARGEDASPGAEKGRVHELPGVGELEDRLLQHGETSLQELVHVRAIVDAEHLVGVRDPKRVQ